MRRVVNGIAIGAVLSSCLLAYKVVSVEKNYTEYLSKANKSLEVSQSKLYETGEKVKQLISINEDLTKKVSDQEKLIKELQKNGKYNVSRFRVTAYSPYENVSGIENNGDADATSTGGKPRVGTIAVDPTVVPYYSNIIILYDDGSIYRGKALDCGGAIKGNRLDVFKWTYSETERHGIKDATVIWWK